MPLDIKELLDAGLRLLHEERAQEQGLVVEQQKMEPIVRPETESESLPQELGPSEKAILSLSQEEIESLRKILMK